jgi:tubulin polyglutamylase TTLL9
VAIQKHAAGYDEVIGGTWYVERLKQYLLSKFGEEMTNISFLKVQEIIIKTL